MLENLHFTYDGKSSKDFGVVLVNPSGGLYKETFIPTRKIVETSVAGRRNPFFQRVDDDPLSFSFAIYLPEWEERNNLRQIARWLYQPYYKPLIFESNPDIVYYAMFIDKSELTHNGLYEGYISLTVRMNSPYIHSIPHEENFDINGKETKVIYNNGDLPMRMKMEIKNKQINHRVAMTIVETGEVLLLTNLLPNETVYVDCINEHITSSLEDTGRYLIDNHNDQWLTIEPETSARLAINADASFKITYQYAYLNLDTELIGRGDNC